MRLWKLAYLITVNVVQAIEELLHDFLNLTQAEFDVDVRQQASKVMFAEIKHQVECRSVFVMRSGTRPTNFNQIDDIFVFQ